jgi:hypothetical protein
MNERKKERKKERTEDRKMDGRLDRHTDRQTKKTRTGRQANKLNNQQTWIIWLIHGQTYGWRDWWADRTNGRAEIKAGRHQGRQKVTTTQELTLLFKRS